MSKELENIIPDNPLDCLKALRTSANSYCSFNNTQCEYNKKLADNIEKTLKRLESIDNSNSSEALRALDRNIVVIREKDYTIIEQSLLKAQEQEKVLEIIWKKNVDIIALKESKILVEYNRNSWEVEDYGKYEGYRLQLTQEEFELLRSVLVE